MNKKDYKKAVKKLNCKYAKKNGICSLLKEFCPLGPCLDFEQKHNKRKLRKIKSICDRYNITEEKIIVHNNNIIVCSPRDIGRMACGKTKELI